MTTTTKCNQLLLHHAWSASTEVQTGSIDAHQESRISTDLHVVHAILIAILVSCVVGTCMQPKALSRLCQIEATIRTGTTFDEYATANLCCPRHSPFPLPL